jgi:hypothetical protein
MIASLKNKTKVNSTLLKVLCISLLVHVVFAFLAGLVTIANYVIKEQQFFDSPPMTVEKPPPEIKIEIKPRNTKKMQPERNFRMREVGNISIDSVDVDLPSMGENFTVSSTLDGVSGGIFSTGARGNFDFGISDVSVFGLKARSERVLFMIDAHRRMVTDAKGGLRSYRIIKDEVSDMIGNLSPGTLFNVIVYDHRRILKFKTNLVPAGTQVHTDLVKWIGKINSDSDRPGLESFSEKVLPKLSAYSENKMQDHLEWSNGHNDTAFISQVAIEQQADTIFFITGFHRGFGKVVAPPSKKRLQEWEVLKSSEGFQQQLRNYEDEVPKMIKRIDQKLAEINKERTKAGLPKRVLAKARHDVRGNAGELGLKWVNPHPPGGPGHEELGPQKTVQYFKELLLHLFADRDKPNPTINIILFLAGDEVYQQVWQDDLEAFVRFFKGRSRIIRGENQIRNARSSNDI